MICRLWHGWTTPANADPYERLLKEEVFQGIVGRNIAGLRGFELLRRAGAATTEFMTVMWFDSIEAVREFAGDDYEAAVVPPAARALLLRYDARSSHFEVRHVVAGNPGAPLIHSGISGPPAAPPEAG